MCLLVVLAVGQSLTAAEPNAGAAPADTAAADVLPPAPTVYNQPDTVFSRIDLTPDGVIAVDTFGHYWQYDFISALFIPYQPVVKDEISNLPPVADRCTEEVRPRPFSREVV
ncbi:MAG: hypothetical protein D6800_08830, partial [Candidatus Zixiibacteriota bacterium]